jgi:hypothetical protein
LSLQQREALDAILEERFTISQHQLLLAQAFGQFLNRTNEAARYVALTVDYAVFNLYVLFYNPQFLAQTAYLYPIDTLDWS